MEGNFMLPAVTLFPMIGAVIAYLVGKKNKTAGTAIANSIVFVEFIQIFYLFYMYCLGQKAGGIISAPVTDTSNLMGVSGYVAYCNVADFCGMGLSFSMDGFRLFYALIASFMWMMATLFSKEYFAHYRNTERYYLFLLLTLGATVGIFFSADFYTLFIFFEIMSFTSYAWVAHDEKKESLRAAETYLAVAVIGGLVMLMGIFLLYHEMGTLNINSLYEMCIEYRKGIGAEYETHINTLYIAGACMLFGFGAKAGAFPLHIWLPKAHPVAPAPASALLSGILTKTGIFGILAISCNIFLYDLKWGTLVLLIGVLTMIIGAVLALFSIDLKRTLACSSVSQIGFILIGIGMQGLLASENGTAAAGTILHMVNHSLFKLVLFMVAGVVFMNVHKLNLNEIRGFGRKKPLLNFAFLMGALGIGGIPLLSGYVSKTLLHESILEYMEQLRMGNVTESILSIGEMKSIEWLFIICGGITVAYMLKLYIAIFVEKNTQSFVQEKFDSLKGTYMNHISAFAVAAAAVFFPLMGMLPNIVMDGIATFTGSFMHTDGIKEKINYFSFDNLTGSFVSLIIGVLIYFLIVRKWMMKADDLKMEKVYIDRWNKNWDLENSIYRPLLLKIFPMIFGVICRILDSLVDSIIVLLRKTIYRDSKLPHPLEEGNFFTHILGVGSNHLIHIFNLTMWKNEPREETAEHNLALKYEELEADKTIIARSMSFGLLLFCAGLITTLVYLLWK